MCIRDSRGGEVQCQPLQLCTPLLGNACVRRAIRTSSTMCVKQFLIRRSDVNSPHMSFALSYARLTHSHASAAASPGEILWLSLSAQWVAKNTNVCICQCAAQMYAKVSVQCGW